ncbi:MAG: AMP-binding protein, partial [Acidobacteriota bacterium]
MLDQHGGASALGVIGRIAVDRSLTRQPLDDSWLPSPMGGGDLVLTGDRGRWLPDGRLELHGPAHGCLWWRGERLDLADLSVQIARVPEVREAAVVSRRSSAAWEPVVYLTGKYRRPLGALLDACTRQLDDGLRLQRWQRFGRLPRDVKGRLDLATLEATPLADADATGRWRRAIESIPAVRRAHALVRPEVPAQRSHHVLDLVPRGQSSPPARRRAAPAQIEAGPRPPAIARGGALEIPAGAPSTLPEALLRTVRSFPDRGILCLDAQGAEHFISYPDLLDRARRILGGLSEAGLKPGDRTILQCQRLPDHFAAFWACVLGGIVPVTVAISPSFDAPNAVLAKERGKASERFFQIGVGQDPGPLEEFPDIPDFGQDS